MLGGCLWCFSLIYVFSVGNSIELLGFKHHLQSKKKKKKTKVEHKPTNQGFNHTFISQLLSAQPPFPTIKGYLASISPGCSNTKCPQGNLFHPFASNSCIPSHHLVYHYRLWHRLKITMLLSRSHCQLLLLVPSICPVSVSSADPRSNAPGSLGVSRRLSFVFVSIVHYTPALFSIWNPFNHSISFLWCTHFLFKKIVFFWAYTVYQAYTQAKFVYIST